MSEPGIQTKGYDRFTPEAYSEPNTTRDLRDYVLRRLDVIGAALKPKNGPADFERAFEAWDSLQVQVQNVRSFEEKLSKMKRKDRMSMDHYFHYRTRELIKVGIKEQRTEVQEILQRTSTYNNQSTWYQVAPSHDVDLQRLLACHQRHDHSVSAVGWTAAEGFSYYLRSLVLGKVDDGTGCTLRDTEARQHSLEIDIPEVVHVKEGEELKIPFTLSVIGPFEKEGTAEVNYIVEYPKTGQPKVAGHSGWVKSLNEWNGSTQKPSNYISTYNYEGERFTHELNRSTVTVNQQEHLTAKIPKLIKTHQSPVFYVVLDFIPKFAGHLRTTRFVQVIIDNEDAPPEDVEISSPKFNRAETVHIAEGATACFAALGEDIEGDAIQYSWSLRSGDAALSAWGPGDKFLCVTTPDSHRLEYPLDLELKATSVFDREKYPAVVPQSSTVNRLIYVDPTLQLPTGEKIKMDPDVVEMLTQSDPSLSTPIPIATESNLYVFAQLPYSLKSFDRAQLNSQIASEVAVQSADVTAKSHRQWTTFQEVPSGPHVIFSSSPLRRWTPAGNYSFAAKEPADASKLTVFNPETWSTIVLPVRGRVHVDVPGLTTQISIQAQNYEWGKVWGFEIAFSNALDGDLPFYQSPNELDIQVEVHRFTEVGKIKLERNAKAKLLEIDNRGRLKYSMPLYLAEEYAANASVKLTFSMKNRHGEVAEFEYSIETPKSKIDDTVLEKMTASVVNDWLPTPWYQMEFSPNLSFPALSLDQYKKRLTTNMEICPPAILSDFIRDCSDLDQKGSNQEQNNKTFSVALKLVRHRERQALAYRLAGGSIRGTYSLNLPEDPYKSEKQKWPWRASVAVPKFAYQIDSLPELFVKKWQVSNPRFHSFVILKDLLKKFEATLTPNSPSGVQVKAEKKLVNHGEDFYVDIEIPSAKSNKNISFKSFDEDELATLMRIDLVSSDPTHEAGYRLKPTTMTELGDRKRRLHFNFPDKMPQGQYEAVIRPLRTLYGTYIFSYSHSARVWNKEIPTAVWEAGKEVPLDGIQFLGDPLLKPPRSRGTKTELVTRNSP